MAVIGGSGQKPPTALKTGRLAFYGNGNGDYIYSYTNATQYTYTGQPNLVTVVDISPAGGGFLQFSLLAGSNASTTLSQVIITIDGVIVINEAQTGGDTLNGSGMIQAGTYCNPQNLGPTVTFEQIRFNSSLKIQVKSQNACRYFYSYYLT